MIVTTIVGARPQFVKAAAVSRELAAVGIEETIVHTGQHYDPDMSRVFFDELGIPEPSVNLSVGSATQAVQTGSIMVALEKFIAERPRPRVVLVYGDTNSTLAAALVAAKLNVPVAHVEAGLRSFNRLMPEEINRIVTDRLSDLLFCPTPTSVANLSAEGMIAGVHLTGDVMLDATRMFADVAASTLDPLSVCGHPPGTYCVATVHRAENTDDPGRLKSIFSALGRIAGPIVVPLHPRTRSRITDISIPDNVEIRDPAGYLEMLTLVRHARMVLTDSGGLQKEAIWLETPCITLRDETEWVETCERGWNQVVGADPDAIVVAATHMPKPPVPSFAVPGASKRIASILRDLQ